MSVKIRVQNFQSIADATIEVDGLTVVYGTNNTGKSALMRAVRGAFQNLRGTAFVRHGCPKAAVTVTFGDGQSVVWEKGRGKGDKPTYVVNGGKPLHPGQGVPDEVRDLGVRPILAGGREVWPQFAAQLTGTVFLLDQPGSVLAEAVADVDRVTQLNDAQRAAESDRRAAAAELKIRLGDRDTIQKELDRFKGLDKTAVAVAAVENEHAAVTKIERAIGGLVEIRGRRNAARAAVVRLSGADAIMVPDEAITGAVVKQATEIAVLVALRDRLVRVRASVDHWAGVEGFTVPDDRATGAVARVVSELDVGERLHERLVAATVAVNGLAGVMKITALPDEAPAVKAHAKLGVGLDLRVRYRTVLAGTETAERDVAAAEVAAEGSNQELIELLGDWGECPYCGSVVSHHTCGGVPS